MNIYEDCRDCKNYPNDCGNHYVDNFGHIHYEEPLGIFMYDVIGKHGRCFEPSEEYKLAEKEKIAEELSKYSVETLMLALEIAKGNKQ